MTDQKVFPKLYTLTSTKATRYWSVESRTFNGEAQIVVRYGQLGGKEVETIKILSSAKSKATPYLQAEFEAQSLWNEKKDKKGYIEDLSNLQNQLMGTQAPIIKAKIPMKLKQKPVSVVNQAGKIVIPKKSTPTPIPIQSTATMMVNLAPQANVSVNLYDKYVSFKYLPMLANKFTEKKSYVKYPCYVQPKLDGVRYTARKINDTEAMLRTRNDGECPFFYEIKNAIGQIELAPGVFLDGEFYSLKIPFRTLNGYCNRKTWESKSKTCYTKIPKDHLESIHYYIFDCYFVDQPNKPYSERMAYLTEIFQKQSSPYLKFVGTETAEKIEEIQGFHDKYVAEGHEGLMIRNQSSAYKLKDRSNDLLKYKEFQDEEYEIVGAECPDNGKEGPDVANGLPGCVIWKLKLKDSDLTFTCRPRDTHYSRRQDMQTYLVDPSVFVGQQYTVRFQEKYDNGIPRFPVGVAIRYD